MIFGFLRRERMGASLPTSIKTTSFLGNYYEVTGSSVTKYYYAGSQRIAMKKDGTLNYLLGDHLGSTSLSTDANGTVISELRYKAWGEVRYTTGITPTQYQYTGQYSHTSDFGLLFYNARWYDPSLGRFNQPDTMVPGGVQGYDRYAYVSNNPLRYTDPTGHMEVEGCGAEGKDACHASDLEAAINAQKLADLEYDPTGQKQRRNSAVAETILYGGTELLASVFFEPADWAFTAYHCANGDCSAWMLLGLLPIIPASLGSHADDAVDVGTDAVRTFYRGDEAGETYIRYMSEAELRAVHQTGFLRGGNPGVTYMTTDVFETAGGATSRLSLTTPPSVGVQFQVVNNAQIVGPQLVDALTSPLRSGGGTEFWTSDKVQVAILYVWDLLQ